MNYGLSGLVLSGLCLVFDRFVDPLSSQDLVPDCVSCLLYFGPGLSPSHSHPQGISGLSGPLTVVSFGFLAEWFALGRASMGLSLLVTSFCVGSWSAPLGRSHGQFVWLCFLSLGSMSAVSLHPGMGTVTCLPSRCLLALMAGCWL